MARGYRLYTSGLYFFLSISLCGRLQADDGVQFVDVAAEVGVTLMNVSGDGEQQYVVDAFIGGIGLLRLRPGRGSWICMC